MEEVAYEKKEHIEETREIDTMNINVELTSTKKESFLNSVNALETYLNNKNTQFQKIMPRKKIAKITTRKSPCGNGTCTFAKYEMRIYKCVFKFTVPHEELTHISGLIKGAETIIEVVVDNE